MRNTRCVTLLALWLVVASATPVRRSPDLEARRRSAIDRSMIRFGRSYPAEHSAGDNTDPFHRPTRSGNSFLRFGRSSMVSLPYADLISLLKAYEEDYDNSGDANRENNIRNGRSPDIDRSVYDLNDMLSSRYPQRKHRARNSFIRFGRANEETNDSGFEEVEENRKKRSAV